MGSARSQFSVVGKIDHSFDNLLKFSHIARLWIQLQVGNDFRIYRVDLDSQPAAGFLQKVIEEQRSIFLTFSQGRKIDGDDIQL